MMKRVYSSNLAGEMMGIMKDIVADMYNLLIFIFTSICKQVPMKHKVVMVSSFGENHEELYKELSLRDENISFVFVNKKRVKGKELTRKNGELFHLDIRSPFQIIPILYHISTAKLVFVDDYFLFLGGMNFREGTVCIQTWHAVGAVKKFGIEAFSNMQRSTMAINRFNRVYKKFDKIVVGSDKMANIFKQMFHINEDRFIKTGVPRTDIFFNRKQIDKITDNFFDKHVHLKNKKVILYAPTYRDDELSEFSFKLDLEEWIPWLEKENAVLLLRLHPAISHRLDNIGKNGSIYDFTDFEDVNHLLLITDTLITDYSSLPFEFVLAGGERIIYYCYDHDEYKKHVGFSIDYINEMKGCFVYRHEDLLSVTQDNEWNINNSSEFNYTWNQYSNGHSSKKLVDYLYESKII